MEKGNLPQLGSIGAVERLDARNPLHVGLGRRLSFLRIPPFPGAKVRDFAERDAAAPLSHDVADEIRRLRVGGTYWSAQPELPADCVIVRSGAALKAAERLAEGRPIVLWSPEGSSAAAFHETMVISGDCDPWHMLDAAAMVVLDADDELRAIARLLGVPTYVHEAETERLSLDDADARALLAEALARSQFDNPFTGEPMSIAETVELCGFWRRLID